MTFLTSSLIRYPPFATVFGESFPSLQNNSIEIFICEENRKNTRDFFVPFRYLRRRVNEFLRPLKSPMGKISEL